MHTLGISLFQKASIQAGYGISGMAPLLSHIVELGLLELKGKVTGCFVILSLLVLKIPPPEEPCC